MKKLINHGILISALLAGTALPLAAQTSGTTGDPDQPSNRQQWRAMREQMAAEIKTQDAELKQLTEQMNNAPENKKADAVAAVVNKLVQDRLALHQKMESMHQHRKGTTAPSDHGTETSPPTP